jgi:catechol 2,3-dioxygenase-like lactoylglutathione lyase family enzyme
VEGTRLTIAWHGRSHLPRLDGHLVETQELAMTHKNIPYVALFVDDQDRALDFYTNVLGFEKRTDNPTPEGPKFLTVGVPGQDVALVLWPGTPGKAAPVGGMPAAAVTIETPSCKDAFEALRAKGVRFDPPGPIERPWGTVARFQDPFGNLLQLREGRAAPR